MLTHPRRLMLRSSCDRARSTAPLTRSVRILALALILCQPLPSLFACELPGKITSERQITADMTRSLWPAVAFTGTEYAVVWEDELNGEAEIYFMRLDRKGIPLGAPLRITNAPSYSLEPSIAWTGTEFGVAWYDYRDGNWEVYFTRLDDHGARLTGDIRLTNGSADSYRPRLVWTGNAYGVVWIDSRDGNQELYFRRIPQTGAPGPEVRVTNAPDDSTYPAIVWNGSEYGLAWHDYRDGDWEIYFARLNEAGALLSGPTRITQAFGPSVHPTIAWNGMGYGIAWDDSRGGEPNQVYFAELDSDGMVVVGDRNISHTSFNVVDPVLSWIGDEYALVWWDARNLTSIQIYFHRLSKGAATPLQDELRLGGEGETASGVALVVAGPVLTVVWQWATIPVTSNTQNYELGMVRMGCDVTDADGDGVLVYAGCDINNECDNCASVPNADQADLDLDSEGDVCDLDDGFIYLDVSGSSSVGYQLEAGFIAFNIYRGSMSVLRTTNVYTQDTLVVPAANRFCDETSGSVLDPFVPGAGVDVYYLVTGVDATGSESSLGTSAGQPRANDHPCP